MTSRAVESAPHIDIDAGWYYVTMPGTMKVTYADGKTQTWNAKAGEQAWMDAEPAHTSENIGTTYDPVCSGGSENPSRERTEVQ